MAAALIERHPLRWARIGGLIYLVIIAAGLFGELAVRGTLVTSDAATTAHNIAASPLLWRAGIAADLLMQLCDIPLMLIFYVLLRTVDRNVALMALLFNIVQTCVLVLNKLTLLLPLILLDAAAKGTLETGQAEGLSRLAISAHGYGFGLGLTFFGFTCLLEGYLIYRSGFLPRVIGIGMAVAGVCYVVNTFLMILAPDLASAAFPAIMLPPFLFESTFCVWLLVKGIDADAWRVRADA